jgi:hypothetical protein
MRKLHTLKQICVICIFAVSILCLPTCSNLTQSSDTVYITETGSKYHRASCQYLYNSKIAISREEAVKEGYTACSVCKP